MTSTKTDIAILQTKLDSMHDDIGEHKDRSELRSKEIIGLLKTQNGRIGKLEQFRSWIKGGLALAVVFLPASIWVFQKLFN